MKRMITFTMIGVLLALLSSCGAFSEKNSTEYKKAEIYYTQGTSYLVGKRYTNALNSLLKAVKLNPTNAEYQNNLGMAYYFKGDHQNAIIVLQKAMELDPSNYDSANNLASIYYNLGEYQKSESIYRKIATDLSYTKIYRVYYNLALIELKKGQIPTAKDFLNMSINENPEYCVSHIKLGQIAEWGTKLNEALTHYKNAIKGACYNIPSTQLYLGALYLKLGQYNLAKETYASVVQRFGDETEGKVARDKLEKIYLMEENKKNKSIFSSLEENFNKEYETPNF